jgi:L,D-peptidoglycan transpeptidase YkuD (ErfK/YbiS/YcfS/YnhG family)
MNLVIKTAHKALWNGRDMRCAVGRGGIVTADAKHEGDGCTPAGSWAMREMFYRADRETAPVTGLQMRALTPEDAWCDVEGDPAYNRLVRLPYPTRDEKLWREDHLYDLVVVLGYNDDPPRAGRGSAIFLHLARPDFSPSSGCVTLGRDDLLTVLREATGQTYVQILKA